VEDVFEGSLASVEKKMSKKWKADNTRRRFEAELRTLNPSGPACSRSNQSVMCLQASGSEGEVPIDPRLQYIQSNSPSLAYSFDNIISQIDFGVDAMHFLNLVEDGIQWGRPAYRQIKYAVPLGGIEWGIDAGLQLYDDHNLILTPGDQIGRAIIRGFESAVIDGASIGMGLFAAAALQVNVPVPVVSAGVGYVVGSYSTSAILDNLASQKNPALFRWAGLGGP
jgi:hypothetical protein